MPSAWAIEELPWPTDVPATVLALALDGELAWLDSAPQGADADLKTGCSLIAQRPRAVLEQFDQRPARLIIDGHVAAESVSGWDLWKQVASRLPRWPLTPWALAPGWVGYVGFEMAGQLERLPQSHREDLGLPLLRLALFDRGIVLDHRRQRAFFVLAPDVEDALGIERSRKASGPGEWDFARRPVACVPGSNIGGASSYIGGASDPYDTGFGRDVRIHHEVSRADYERMVGRALAYIRAGDIYQVNLAQRLRLDGVGDALTTYAAIRRSNPAPYAALLRWNDCAVASFSPELFLRLRGDAVRTRPIKGTRPRTGAAAADEAARRELLASAKEAAELTMIVDLHRNDLGRVCRYGSVRVEHPRRVEAHPTVFHTVADVVGRLAPHRDGLDLLAACFPAGSISGVPKIRALQIIDELEPAARGVYTGAIGAWGLDGQMTFNVAIRTLQMRADAATLYVGGGIVADSDPAAEYEETLAKARGILRGFSRTSGEPRSVPCDIGSV